MAVLGKLGEKQYTGKGAPGGLHFFGGAHVPAAFPSGDSPICMAPKLESTDISERPKPSEPTTRSGISGGREVKPVPPAKRARRRAQQGGMDV